MPLRFDYRPYVRAFKSPLQTAHGRWAQREGILIRLEVEGRVGFGEIAPIPWFGTETLDQAEEFCAPLARRVDLSPFPVPRNLPACEFAIAAALQSLSASPYHLKLVPARVCALLPAGEAVLTAWEEPWQKGHRTFKWKIGGYPLDLELSWFEALCSRLPASARLRLDANGGLTLEESQQWLTACDGKAAIEFLEQPLPPSQLNDLMALNHPSLTPLALDESVANCDQLENHLRKGWNGIVVVKPAIAGSPHRLQALCRKYNADAVVSSAFETGVGRQAVLALAEDISPHRALGFGTGDRCWDDWDHLSGEELWERL
ncbi:o-succinylbenzoate synthase [filamentous cyanobacterium CCP5]|nr:o-succinylbenzoate synthase [filamentous cyanobacterium CCP5]